MGSLSQLLVQYYFYLLFYLNCEDQQQTVSLIEKIVELFASVNSVEEDSDDYDLIMKMAMVESDDFLEGTLELSRSFMKLLPICLGSEKEFRCPMLPELQFTNDNSLFSFLRENARSQAVKEYFNL